MFKKRGKERGGSEGVRNRKRERERTQNKEIFPKERVKTEEGRK